MNKVATSAACAATSGAGKDFPEKDGVPPKDSNAEACLGRGRSEKNRQWEWSLIGASGRPLARPVFLAIVKLTHD